MPKPQKHPNAKAKAAREKQPKRQRHVGPKVLHPIKADAKPEEKNEEGLKRFRSRITGTRKQQQTQ